MDGKRFDELSRRFATRQSRRRFFGVIGAAAASALTHQTSGAAPKEDKPAKCYGEGSSCTNAKQCCSGICTNRQCAAEIPTCVGPADCAGIDDECQQRTCTNGICGVAYTGSQIPVSAQVFGDCQSNVCDGSGGIMKIADDSDVPASPSACAIGTCTGGEPSVEFLDPRTPCATGGFVCDGAGQCLACLPGDTRSCYTGPAGTAGVGICRAGTQTCRADGSGFGACIGEVLPRAEQCNGLDDDCDGSVDEGALGVGAFCSTGLAGVCAQGILQCQSGALRCVPNVQPGSRIEICNGLDDDCDGVVDEGTCLAPQECQFSRGSYRCCLPQGELTFGDCDQCCDGCEFPFLTCS